MKAPHVVGELTLREVQLASLEILKKIDAVCQKEDIRYWLMYGTLIGAVRHHGFIPWDDDLDIAMPRPDYERFLAWFRDHADQMRPLVALDGYRQRLPFLITRVSDTTYRMVGEYGDEVPELGTFIDIYPIDGCGNSIEEATAHKKQCISENVRYAQAGNFASNNREAGAVKRGLKKIHSAMLGDAGKHAEILHSWVTRYPFDHSQYVACLEWDWKLTDIYPYELVKSLKRVPFEDTTASIPVGYDEMLTMYYGDYMKLPPEEERIGHHFYSIVRR